MSCQKEARHRKAIRETWGKEIPANWDLKFFVGTSSWEPEKDPANVAFIGTAASLGTMHSTKAEIPPLSQHIDEPDVVLGDFPDSYLGTSWKGKAIQRYAKEHNYDGLFLACIDTLLNPAMLSRVCIGDCSAQTFIAAPALAYPVSGVMCPHGGYGYWLSRKALDAIYDEPVRHYSEDQSTCFALHHAGIRITNNRMFSSTRLLGGHWIVGTISQHLSTRHVKFEPEDIYAAWNKSRQRIEKYPGWDGTCQKCGDLKFKLGIYGPQCTGCGNRQPWKT